MILKGRNTSSIWLGVVFVGLSDRSHLVDILRAKKNERIFNIDGEINYWNLTRCYYVRFSDTRDEQFQADGWFKVPSSVLFIRAIFFSVVVRDVICQDSTRD